MDKLIVGYVNCLSDSYFRTAFSIILILVLFNSNEMHYLLLTFSLIFALFI